MNIYVAYVQNIYTKNPWLKRILYVVYHLYFTKKIIGSFDTTYCLTKSIKTLKYGCDQLKIPVQLQKSRNVFFTSYILRLTVLVDSKNRKFLWSCF